MAFFYIIYESFERTTQVQWAIAAGAGGHYSTRSAKTDIKTKQVLKMVKDNPSLPLSKDIIAHPPKILKSRHLIRDLEIPTESVLKVWKNTLQKIRSTKRYTN